MTDQRTRTAKTLGCLVASMTAGTALLSWMEPRDIPREIRPGPLLIAHPAARAVESWTSTSTTRWRGVVVHFLGQRLPPGAVGDSRLLHFVVEPDGRVWRGKANGKAADGVIRVGIAGAATHPDRMSAAQGRGLRRLLHRLRAEYGIAPGSVFWASGGPASGSQLERLRLSPEAPR